MNYFMLNADQKNIWREIGGDSNIHKYIFDKQDNEIFKEYHDIVAKVGFSMTNVVEMIYSQLIMCFNLNFRN